MSITNKLAFLLFRMIAFGVRCNVAAARTPRGIEALHINIEFVLQLEGSLSSSVITVGPATSRTAQPVLSRKRHEADDCSQATNYVGHALLILALVVFVTCGAYSTQAKASTVATEIGTTHRASAMYERDACLAEIRVPQAWIRGNGMVGGGADSAIGCGALTAQGRAQFNITYYLSDPNLSPNEATKIIEFHIYKKGLNQLLKASENDYLRRDSTGNIVVKADAEFTTCGNDIVRHITSSISGRNWNGSIVESVFASRQNKRAIAGCPQYNARYRCINMAIGNEKSSAVLHSRCFLRRSDNTLHTEMSYDMFMEMMKTWHFKD